MINNALGQNMEKNIFSFDSDYLDVGGALYIKVPSGKS